MGKFKVPNTYVIIFAALFFCCMATWLVPGGNPQTWQLFSAMFEGFSRQAEIIAFVLIIGGAFWVLNSTKAMDEGIAKFIGALTKLERFSLVRKLGVGNIVITLIMLMFGLFGALFGMSEETIAFVAVVIPLAKSLGYNEITAVCMVYVAAHVGFAGAMLNPFTVGIAQGMADLPLFSGLEYRILCWIILMAVAIAFTLWYANKIRKPVKTEQISETSGENQKGSGARAWICYGILTIVMAVFAFLYASDCVVTLGQSKYAAPWLLWVVTAMFAIVSVYALRSSTKMFILNLLMFTIVYLIVGAMGFGWYLPEICALFTAMAIAIGFSADYDADIIAKEFVAGAKDIFSAALIIGFAAGIVIILENGNVIVPMLESVASVFADAGAAVSLGFMYAIETFINLFIPSASAKATATIPLFAELSDMINVPRQSTVLAFQFGDGFTNMITPCSGVLMAVLSVAKIPYTKWVKWVWKFILFLVILGFVLLLPTVYFNIAGYSTEKPKEKTEEFWLGADLGWITEYEFYGKKFYNAEGKEMECTALMKELGLNAVRHRVWVDPSEHGGWCDKEDLLVKCLRAKELGMEIMIDFHYSDWWADPAKQNIPASWSGHSYEQMKEDLTAHTTEVLTYLKNCGVEPKWIQVGNETRNGFLWSVRSNESGWPVLDENGNTTITESMGHVVRNPEQYAGFFAEGYNACKKVYPDAIVMVHLDNGFDKDLYDYNLGILKKYGAKWDMIGMSLYPYWALDGGFRDDEEQTITDCIENIKYVSERFGCDVMIVETGFLVDESDPVRMETSRRQLARVIRESINNTDGRCKGVFYWEPECRPSQYKLGAFTEDGRPTVIMDAFKEWEK
jgi:uncharacterized ion transporter superfamily protein YfcC